MLTQTLSFELSKELAFLALLAIVIYIIFIIANSKGFLNLPKTKTQNPISILHVGISIFLFFVPISLIGLLSYPTIQFILKKVSLTPITKQTLLSFTTLFIMVLGAFLFLKVIGKKVSKYVWNLTAEFSIKKSLLDISFGILFFLIALPITLFFSNLTTFIIYSVFKIKELPDQEAVYFMRQVLSQPKLIVFGFLTVSIFVPFIEEFLFRGMIQNWLKNHFRPSISIFITSILFSISHFSINQKLANFPLLISIFALSILLGLIYEKRSSLLASISLHATFNSMVLLQMLFIQNS